jgi:hypothetical protein
LTVQNYPEKVKTTHFTSLRLCVTVVFLPHDTLIRDCGDESLLKKHGETLFMRVLNKSGGTELSGKAVWPTAKRSIL